MIVFLNTIILNSFIFIFGLKFLIVGRNRLNKVIKVLVDNWIWLGSWRSFSSLFSKRPLNLWRAGAWVWKDAESHSQGLWLRSTDDRNCPSPVRSKDGFSYLTPLSNQWSSLAATQTFFKEVKHLQGPKQVQLSTRSKLK